MGRKQAANGFWKDAACEWRPTGVGEYKPHERMEEREKLNNGSGKNIPGSKDKGKTVSSGKSKPWAILAISSVQFSRSVVSDS